MSFSNQQKASIAQINFALYLIEYTGQNEDKVPELDNMTKIEVTELIENLLKCKAKR